MIELTLAGDPVTKLRARFARHKCKVRTYDSQTDEKNTVRWQLKSRVIDQSPLEGSLFLNLLFVFKRPKSRRNEIYHSIKPDLDNLVKWVCDAGNNILWVDDKQIVKIDAIKIYGDKACTKLRVGSVDATPDRFTVKDWIYE